MPSEFPKVGTGEGEAGEYGVSHHSHLLASARIPPGPAPEMQRLARAWSSNILNHVTNLTLSPQSLWRGFRFDAHGQRFNDVVHAEHRSGAVSGTSGNGDESDPVVVHYVLSGQVQFEGENSKITINPGEMCVRDSRKRWRFWYDPGTAYRWVTVPRSRVSPLQLSGGPLVATRSNPEVKLLIAYLEMVNDHASSVISMSGKAAVADATIGLLRGVISANAAQGITDRGDVLVIAAKKVIDENLEERDLSPLMVAQILGVSTRTLHRCFTAGDDSVMSYVRRRRTEEAQREIIESSATVSFGELAAKWHFSDASHFTRTFKKMYGTTPTAYLEKLRSAAHR
ncbi:helix-turn-helix domain-containing protein [Streptomyces sp. MI02-7b]|uniref:helix-turn-helix domain-containing protein n=1 Tax=Streptomyces sp. MI02-7b TaxID=462941 RepID=UPI0029A54187|nr:helix-turn-helix domain-containing protein [Streptomyces sp. MI02-7b]MDX3075385.1 helix-turn-helix domain-containing protein [Streptomyces sp. MI02-7b]